MKILAIDTSTDACSVAIQSDSDIINRTQVAPRLHAELILPMLDSLLSEAGLCLTQMDAIALGCGPGAFTGLRVAAGVTQALAYAADLPVVKVSTLTAIAQRGWREHASKKVLAGLDARLKEVYWSACQLNDEGYMEPVAEECVCRPESIPLPVSDGWYGLGSAWTSYHAELAQRLNGHCKHWQGECDPDAIDIAVLGSYYFSKGLIVDASEVIPVYLRNNIVDRR